MKEVVYIHFVIESHGAASFPVKKGTLAIKALGSLIRAKLGVRTDSTKSYFISVKDIISAIVTWYITLELN